MEFSNIKSHHAGPEDILVSFNVFLFTMVPTGQTLHVLNRHSDEDILRLCCHVLTSSFFRFNEQLCEQINAVAMVSPLSSVTANLLMKHFEETVLDGTTQKPLC
jgi:hypothetical protein